MFTLSKILGAVLTPIYGYISDRLYSTSFGRKHGRRKSLLLIGIPLKFIFYITMWIPGMSIPMYFVFFVAYYVVQPLLTMPQLTFMSEMTEDSKQRAQLVGFNQVAAAFAGIFASIFITWIFKLMGQNNQTSYLITAAIYDVISLFFLIIFYKSVYERPVDESTILRETKQKVNKLKDLKLIFWNFITCIRLKSYGLYLIMYLCEQMFRSLRGVINTYFIIFVLLLTPNTVAMSTSVSFIFGIVFLMFFMWITAKTNGPVSYRIGAWASIVVLVFVGLMAIFRPSHMVLLWMIAITALNFGITGVVNSTQFIFTLIPDVDEMVTGKRREGQYAGVNSTLDILFSTVESLIVGGLLAMTGFVEKSHVQSPATVHALLVLYTVVPIVLLLIGIIVSYFFKMTTKNHAILLNEIKRLRAGGSMKNVTANTRKVVESLTGFKYEECWGNNNLMEIKKSRKI